MRPHAHGPCQLWFIHKPYDCCGIALHISNRESKSNRFILHQLCGASLP